MGYVYVLTHVILFVCATPVSRSHTDTSAGHSKRLFRNRFNDESGKNLESNVRKSMATPKYAVCVGPLFGKDHLKDREGNDLPAPMTISLVRRFARRTRNYERIYERFKTPAAMEMAAKEAGCSGFDLMEKLYRICSVTSTQHRCIFEQEKSLLRKVGKKDIS